MATAHARQIFAESNSIRALPRTPEDSMRATMPSMGEVVIDVRYAKGCERDAIAALDAAYDEIRRQIGGMKVLVRGKVNAED